MAAVAELEAGMISARTKAALAAAKARGKRLGGYRGTFLTEEARKAGRAVIAKRSDARAHDLAPIITQLRAAGTTSLRSLAAALDERGIPTARGEGKWSAEQVRQVLARLSVCA